MSTFRAFRIHRDDKGSVRSGIEYLSVDNLSSGEVLIRSHYSGVNYKDALAATGRGRILKQFPLIGGIDVAGEVVSSDDPRFAPGDEVVVLGRGLSETRDGGFSEYVRVPGNSIEPLPEGLSLYESMAIGTAGFSAALAVTLLEKNDQHPDLGPVLVTGATGGVGSFAIDLLAGLNYEVHALSGKPEAANYLRQLGAREVLDRHLLDFGTRPLESARWGGAVDVVGGDVLSGVIKTVRPYGNVAAVGLAGGTQLNTTVLPFILRGVSLLGVHSVECPASLRHTVWGRLAGDLYPRHLDKIVSGCITLEGLPEVFDSMLAGELHGRMVVDLRA
ncbi:oxidoreductase [Acidihalobacter prosperus]